MVPCGKMDEQRFTPNFGMVSVWKTKGRPRNSWMQEVMREKGINNIGWIDREEWRRKIKLQAQKDVKH